MRLVMLLESYTTLLVNSLQFLPKVFVSAGLGKGVSSGNVDSEVSKKGEEATGGTS